MSNSDDGTFKKHLVKRKQATGQYFTFGNVSAGKYGPQLGLKAFPELKQLVQETPEGQWINFALFLEDRQQNQNRPTGGAAAQTGDVPF